MTKSEKTGAYSFKSEIVYKDKVNDFSLLKITSLF